MSNLDWKILPRIKFWFEILTPCQAFNQKVHNVSGFDSKILPLARFWVQGLYRMSDFDWWNSRSVQFSVENFKIRQFLEKVAFKSSRESFFFRKMDIFCPVSAFSDSLFWKKTVCLVSDLSRKKSQRVRFWNKRFTTRQTMDWNFHNVPYFALKVLLRVMFRNRKIKTFRLWTEKYTTCQFSIGVFDLVWNFQLGFL